MVLLVALFEVHALVLKEEWRGVERSGEIRRGVRGSRSWCFFSHRWPIVIQWPTRSAWLLRSQLRPGHHHAWRAWRDFGSTKVTNNDVSSSSHWSTGIRHSERAGVTSASSRLQRQTELWTGDLRRVVATSCGDPHVSPRRSMYAIYAYIGVV